MYPADKVSHNKNLLGRRHVWEVRGRVERWERRGGQGEEGEWECDYRCQSHTRERLIRLWKRMCRQFIN